MSHFYDPTMTKTRMEMTNFGCAQLERMVMTDIETRSSFLSRTLVSKQAKAIELASDMKAIRSELKKLIVSHKKHSANKADFEAAMK
jgi:hypothetical protein